jgi:hypothetical protein
MSRRILLALLAAASLGMLAGCGEPYVLRGKAISGGYGSIMFVPADDAQLAEGGVGQVNIAIYRDPNQLNQSLFATGRSNGFGEISIPMEGFGVGWMDEQWLIEVRKAGYEAVQSVVTLPSAKQDLRMLITLPPGISVPARQEEDLWEEYKRYR